MSKKFQAIFDEHDDKKKGPKRSVECIRTLNDKVRPAIRDASEFLESKGLQCNDLSDEPNIFSEENGNEVRFICRGDAFEVLFTINGQTKRYLHAEVQHQVPDNVISDCIAEFLRKHLKELKPRGQRS